MKVSLGSLISMDLRKLRSMEDKGLPIHGSKREKSNLLIYEEFSQSRLTKLAVGEKNRRTILMSPFLTKKLQSLLEIKQEKKKLNRQL